MIIKNISLKNFRQYKSVDLSFSRDPQKPYTIIIGENTYGKTTLIRAFLWCLYRVNYYDDPILLNSDIAGNLKVGDEESVDVTIDLEHKGYSYRITTSIRYRKTESSVTPISNAQTKIFKANDKGTAPVKPEDVKDEVENILREELKDYFFYDGEKNKIDDVSKKSRLKEAVSELMGIKKIETFLDYFNPNSTNGVQSKLHMELKSTNLNLLSLQDDLNSYKEQLESKIKDKNKNEDEISILEEQHDEKQRLLDANRDIKDDQEEKKRLDVSVNKDFDALNGKLENMISSLNKKALLKILFANNYLKNALNEKYSESSFKKEKSLSHINEKVIDQIIQRGYCLCGTKITTNDDAYNHLVASKEFMEPHDFGKYLSDFNDIETSNVNIFSKSTIIDMKTVVEKYMNSVEALNDDYERLESLKKRIEGRTDVGSIQAELNRIERQIDRLTYQNSIIDKETIPGLKDKISKIQQQIDSITENDSHNEFIKRCIEYADHIHKTAVNQSSSKKKEIRDKLEENVNTIFQKMYHGNKKITISEEFLASTNTNGKKLENSMGAETVKNFAFVTGLLGLMKEKLTEELFDGYDVDVPETYPLVMDAPFSNTDEVHIKNICSTIANYCEQIFIVVMNKDFKIAEEIISSKIGKIYKINKISETYAEIKEEF